jgi:hypothetical protein
MEKVVKRNGNKEESCSTLTSINNFTGESAKQRTCVGYSGVQPLLFVIEREGLDFSQCKKREFWLKPTLVRCFALLPVKLFMEVSVRMVDNKLPAFFRINASPKLLIDAK